MLKRTLRTAIISFIVLMLGVNAALANAETLKVKANSAAEGAVKYLQQQTQNADYQGVLEWAMLGLAAADQDISALSKKRELQISKGEMLSPLKNTDYQRSIIGALAAGKDANNYGGQKLLDIVKSSQLPSGKFADTAAGTGEELLNAHIWAIISLYAAGEEIPNADKALQWLAAHQNPDGGFGIDTTADSDIDMTAMAIMAMKCLGKDADYPPIAKALTYLKSKQNNDGSFGLWGVPSTESSAQVVQALIMLGIDPAGEEWTKGGGNPVTGILKFHMNDGSFSHGPEMMPNSIATAQALTALNDYISGQSVYERLRLAQQEKNTTIGGKKEEN